MKKKSFISLQVTHHLLNSMSKIFFFEITSDSIFLYRNNIRLHSRRHSFEDVTLCAHLKLYLIQFFIFCILNVYANGFYCFHLLLVHFIVMKRNSNFSVYCFIFPILFYFKIAFPDHFIK